MKNKGAQWEVRHARPSEPNEVQFIIDTWARVTMEKDTTFIRMDGDTFRINLRERIARLLSTCNCCVLISPTGQPRGFCCYSFDRATLWPIIHFIHQNAQIHYKMEVMVKAAGKSEDIWVTSSVAFLSLRSVKYTRAHFNPFLLDYDPTAPKQ